MNRASFKPINFFLYSFSVAVALLGLSFAYLVLAPVDVLKDWQICTGTFVDGKCVETKTYSTSDVIYLQSKYTKLRKVSGAAHRYIQCQKPNSTEWDGFVLLSEANANRPQSPKASSITYLAIPANLPTLPDLCRIYINVDYEVNQVRTFTEQTFSNTFRVEASGDQAGDNTPVTSDGVTNTNGLNYQLPLPGTTIVVTQTPTGTDHLVQSDDAAVLEDSEPTGHQNTLGRATDSVGNAVTSVVKGIVSIIGL